MSSEVIFKLFFVGLFVAAVTVTVFNQRRAGNYGRGFTSHARSHAQHEAKGLLAIRAGLALLWYPTVLGWLLAPNWIRWSFLTLPEWLRWVGGGTGVVGVLLLSWSQRSMGRNFAPTLAMKEDHRLVTSGPYRWVRHPMYVAFFLMLCGAGVLARNWFMELTGILLITCIMLVRIPAEEVLLANRFGDEYTTYRRKTSAVIPLR